MKKIFTLICLSAMGTFAFAQTQRTVLLEHFTQASCGPCATYNPAIEALINANPGKIIALKHQTSWPGVDPMNAQNPTQVATRVSYYSVTGVPNSVIDGNYYNGHPASVNQAMVDGAYAVPAPFSLSTSIRLPKGMPIVTPSITAVAMFFSFMNFFSK